jgi:hypothetical protein
MTAPTAPAPIVPAPTVTEPRRPGSLVIGAVLIVVGLIAFALTYLDVPETWLEGSGWTLFIIVPGIVLLVAGLVVAHPSGAAVTMLGSILTVIGVMLLAMDRTDSYETWAFAWALIPAAAGIGLVLYGLRAGWSGMVAAGVRLTGIAIAIFLVGTWYFGTIFETGEPPFDLGAVWPLALIGVGAIFALAGIVGRARERSATGG